MPSTIGPNRVFREPRTLVEVLDLQAAVRPHKPAFTYLGNGEHESSVWTYAELDDYSRAVAAQIAANCSPGDRALLLFQPSLEFIAAFFGCLRAGIIPVPAYPPRRNRHDSRLAAIVLDCQPSLAPSSPDLVAEWDQRLFHNPELRDVRSL